MDDFVEAARQVGAEMRGVEAPKIRNGAPEPRILVSTTNRPATVSTDRDRDRRYALGALKGEADLVSLTPAGGRNDALNTAMFNVAGYVTGGHLSREEVWDALEAAARSAGLDETEIRATLLSGERGAAEKIGARAVPALELPPRTIVVPDVETTAEINAGRRISRLPAVTVRDDVPTWAWSYGGKGRIQLGTLALFAGRPGAGKSTAARWFAAQATRGLLDGVWYGIPQRVAYIAPAEESLRFTVKPGLRAAGADLAMIDFLQVFDAEDEVRLLGLVDEHRLTEAFLEWGTTVVIVDPLMSTIHSGVDINRNNETRAYVEPWARIADNINGVVPGVVHLKKDTSGDPVAAINGSSAFGEVARAVFGFAKDPDSDEGDRVMSQAKNSTGHEDLALTYRINTVIVTVDTGAQAEVGVFEITGESEVTVGDVLSGGGLPGEAGAALEARNWLEDYLTEAGREPSKSVKNEARKEGFSEATIKRAAKRLRVVVESEGFPRVTIWSLPRTQSAQSAQLDPGEKS